MIWYNGTIFSDDTALIHTNERGLLLGEGVFETILCQNGKAQFLTAHLTRLKHACQFFGFTFFNGFEEAINHFLAAHAHNAHNVLRITVSGGNGGRGLITRQNTPSYLMQLSPVPDIMAYYRLYVSSIIRNVHNPSSRYKTLSYIDNISARREAVQSGADEALLLTAQGHVACAAAGNIFLYHEGTYITPPCNDGALNGIIRAQLLAAETIGGACFAKHSITQDMLKQAEYGFITNSLIHAIPIHSIHIGGSIYKKASPPDLEAILDFLQEK